MSPIVRTLGAVLLTTFAAGAGASGFLSTWDPGADAAGQVLELSQPERVGDSWHVEADVAEAHYVYRHAFRAVDGKGRELALGLPDGTLRHDEFFGESEIYTPPGLTLQLPATAEGPVTVHWQGCAEAGVCYPPDTLQLTLPAASATTLASAPQDGAAGAASGGTDGDIRANAADSAAQSSVVPAISAATGGDEELAEDQWVAARLDALGPVVGAFLFFGLGLLLAFTPCTLPMLPIVSSLVVGSGNATPRRAVLLSSAYVLTMALTYAALGVAAGLTGANLQAALQSPWLLGGFALLFLVLAASLFGAFELRLPAAIANRLDSAGRKQGGGRLGSAAALGFLSALLVGPCMTAPLAGALLYIGHTGSAVVGGTALFALGLGMGLPLVLIAAFGARVLPRPGPWMERVRTVFGYLMVGMAIYMLSRFVSGPVALMLWGGWALAVAVGLFAWATQKPDSCRVGWSLRFASLFVGAWSALMLVGAASGSDSALHPLQRLASAAPSPGNAAAATPAYVAARSVDEVDARLAAAGARGQWTLIDVYADWCVSCHVIERQVFGDPEVAARLAGMQVLRPDVTANDATDRALQKHWQVLGPPTLILVGPDGRERRAQRSSGMLDASDFLARLDAAGAP